MAVLDRLWRGLLRACWLLLALLVGLVLLALGLTLGLVVWAWLRWRGVPVRPMHWAKGRFADARSARMWTGDRAHRNGDVVDVEAVVASDDHRRDPRRISQDAPP